MQTEADNKGRAMMVSGLLGTVWAKRHDNRRTEHGAPPTIVWRRGISVKDTSLEAISRGTAIATFDEHRRYPIDGSGRHAAVFLGKNAIGIQVLDQWNSQGEVLLRTIRFNNPGKRSNNGDTYHVIE